MRWSAQPPRKRSCARCRPSCAFGTVQSGRSLIPLPSCVRLRFVGSIVEMQAPQKRRRHVVADQRMRPGRRASAPDAGTDARHVESASTAATVDRRLVDGCRRRGRSRATYSSEFRLGFDPRHTQDRLAVPVLTPQAVWRQVSATVPLGTRSCRQSTPVPSSYARSPRAFYQVLTCRTDCGTAGLLRGSLNSGAIRNLARARAHWVQR